VGLDDTAWQAATKQAMQIKAVDRATFSAGVASRATVDPVREMEELFHGAILNASGLAS